MTTTQTSKEYAGQVGTAATVETKLEVITIPVSDVERAKRFYEGLGWRLDADFKGDGWRAVQLTPPGSPCSIHLGSDGVPGSAQGLFLVVDDIEAARAELIAKGADVTEPFHFAGIRGPQLPGPDPERGSYRSYASFKDPDGNGWLLQEITTRLPGRGFSNLDVTMLTELLRETEKHHGEYEPTAPKHHWSGWYAAYVVARERGRTSDEAAQDAKRHIEGALASVSEKRST
jgi:catechol 2,3-dioxygenase-like lactoylglutathione lyase family enzyme